MVLGCFGCVKNDGVGSGWWRMVEDGGVAILGAVLSGVSPATGRFDVTERCI